MVAVIDSLLFIYLFDWFIKFMFFFFSGDFSKYDSIVSMGRLSQRVMFADDKKRDSYGIEADVDGILFLFIFSI